MKNLTIHFKNASAMCLYYMEMEGQISDGKYENSRPCNHWKWVCDVNNMIVDGKSGIESTIGGNSRFWLAGSKKYNLREWFGYINKWRKNNDSDYRWATRIIAFGKFGQIYPELTYETLRSLYEMRILLEELQIKYEMGEKDPEVLFNKVTDFSTCTWRQKYYDACKEYFTPEFVKKFVELNYDVKEVKEDVISMQTSINTDINFWNNI